jgi:hypothetical protein
MQKYVLPAPVAYMIILRFLCSFAPLCDDAKTSVGIWKLGMN